MTTDADSKADRQLDLLLTRAAPMLVPRTDALLGEIDDVVIEARLLANRPRRFRRRAALIGATVIAFVGGGAVAQAAGILFPQPTSASWFTESSALRGDLTLSSGTRCHVVLSAVPIETPAVSSAVTSTDWAELLHDTNAVLSRIRLDSISLPSAAAEWERSQSVGGINATDAAPQDSPDTAEILGLAAEVNDRVDRALQAAGLPTDAVTVASASRCGSGLSDDQ